jgi:hypothetical protein
MASRLREWTHHFLAQGADTFTAGRRAMAMLYRETVVQAQVLSYRDDFWLLLFVYTGVVLLIPFMRRVRANDVVRARARQTTSDTNARDPGLPAAAD